MSGPKDFVFIYGVARLAAIRADLERRRHERRTAIATDMAMAREAAQRAIAGARQTRADLNRAAASGQRAAAAQRLEDIRQREARRHPATPPLPSASVKGTDASVTEDSSTIASATNSPVSDAVPNEGEMSAGLQSVLGWQARLSKDNSVRALTPTVLDEWLREVGRVVAGQDDGSLDGNSLIQLCQELTTRAEQIHADAETLDDKFQIRNALLNDMIESFKEIGYFVSDPYFENPRDPTGAVLLKAVCGSEEITASVDLSERVKSIWNGVTTENCKDSFFAYMDQMAKREILMKPEREDLQDRPILKEKSENELPKNRSSTLGS